MSLEIDTVFRSRAHSRGLLLSALRVFASEFNSYFRRRATHKALSHLNHDELRDIGLVRTTTGYRELHHDRLGEEFWNH
ncbi:hypothetical protein [uncultured Roseibium sp.]|uniref:hypothetical protein n=1 Tax=uncultured Roseibium sp. TaxID=1936171 RepID=UPI00262DD452|nr:hypothetical protein [uncultured Roseibium sp.]